MFRDRDSEYAVVAPTYSASYSFGPPKRDLFSSTEIRDISVAVAALTIAFFVVIYESSAGSVAYHIVLVVTAVLLGFFVHEMSHKFVARRYGCWAEFRADFRGLALAIVVAFIGFLFAAPGAVMIFGRITNEQNGKISLAGPGSNLLVAAACLPIWLFEIEGLPAAVADIAFFVYFFSVFLAGFNMLPFDPFDGAKIWRWSKQVYIVTLAVAGLMFALVL